MCADVVSSVGRGREHKEGRGRGRGAIPKYNPRPPKSCTIDGSAIQDAVPPPPVKGAQTPSTPPTARSSTQSSFPESAVNAKEFVPRFASLPVVPTSTATNEQRPSRLSLEQISTSTKRLKDRHAVNEGDKRMLQHLEETVCILGSYNDSFDDVIESLVKTLKAWVDDERTMEVVMERLFEEGVCNPTFRYIGVRMCDYINEHLEVKKPGSVIRFRKVLLNRCRDELLHFLKVENQEKDRARWFGFCLFLGEVYHQVKTDGQPYWVVGRGCMDNIECLLQNGQPDALFVALSLFKLTGHLMDSDEKLKERVDKCVVDMQNTLDTQPVHRQLQEVGKRTLKLRACNWGNITSPAASPVQQRKFSASSSRQPLAGRDSGYRQAAAVPKRNSLSRTLPVADTFLSATAGAVADYHLPTMAAAEDTTVDPRYYYNESYPEMGYGGYPEELAYSTDSSFSDEWSEFMMPAEYEMTDMWCPEEEMSDEVEAAFEQFLQEQEK
ncbi:polyadenylate-binding protein-interacting protein 1-like isoform X2 [Corticium candelabrum]|uniref:polyadenylate-binding protein-interacting protein 1-like isoform X2 n=1 Tax=Corticium candelabrum TaxID=121492 RepID=UPI002E2576DF|nr:polyadenylate-binding protein-interacting protein 1-like isoform X2 [Corticium candelabrum]